MSDFLELTMSLLIENHLVADNILCSVRILTSSTFDFISIHYRQTRGNVCRKVVDIKKEQDRSLTVYGGGKFIDQSLQFDVGWISKI